MTPKLSEHYNDSLQTDKLKEPLDLKTLKYYNTTWGNIVLRGLSCTTCHFVKKIAWRRPGACVRSRPSCAYDSVACVSQRCAACISWQMQVATGMHNIGAVASEKQQTVQCKQGEVRSSCAKRTNCLVGLLKRNQRRRGEAHAQRASCLQKKKHFFFPGASSSRGGRREREKEKKRGEGGVRLELWRDVNCCKLWLLASVQQEQYFNGCATCGAWGRLADPQRRPPLPPLDQFARKARDG